MTKLPFPLAAQVLTPLGGRFGWSALAAAAAGVFERACTPYGLADCFNLLLELAPAPQKSDGDAPNETNQSSEGVSVTGGGAVPGGTSTAETLGLGGETAGAVAGGSREADAEHRPGGCDELERARLCARVVALLVAKICPPPAAVPAYYSYPPLFCLRDTATASVFVRVLERFGADTWQPAAAVLAKNQVSSALGTVPELLTHLVGTDGTHQSEVPGRASPEAMALARILADALAPALLGERNPPVGIVKPNYRRYPGGRPPAQPVARSPTFVVSVLKACHTLSIDAPVIESLVAHFFATHRLHNVETTLVPALKELAQWLGTPARLETPWFVSLARGCVKALEAKTGTRPAEPRSWALAAACACKCGECRQLVQFCLDPVRTVLQLCVAKPVKKHVQASIKT